MTHEQPGNRPNPLPGAAHSGRQADGHGGRGLLAGAVVGALGVVFGDIGTSPIYTLQTVFDPTDPHPVPVNTVNIYGVASTIFWSVVVIVTVTYVLLAMRADNDGEGGIMALITLVQRTARGHDRRVVTWLAALGVFGAALFLGDSMITPAISVLSAVEGLKIIDPSLTDLVIPITVVIIVALFLVQSRGTAMVGRAFGPVMIVWFVAIGATGVVGIFNHPQVLTALSPTYAIGYIFRNPRVAFFALAAIVLAVTGAEALYADMGHFGRRPITQAWLFLVFPACVLSYFGQAALVLRNPQQVSGPFFLLAPAWGRLALVILSMLATVIASQAVITGAYSVASQAVELGYLPRLRISHTSDESAGQIYVPWINWLLMVSVLTLVFAFRSSAALAFAFGMAVTATITITTILFFYIARRRWNLPMWLVVVGAVPLVFIDLSFVAANLTKFVHGAWLPLLIGLVAFMVMATWQRGRDLVTAIRDEKEGALAPFVKWMLSAPEVAVVPGTAIFLNRSVHTVPLALRANVVHNHVRHQHIVIVSMTTESVPRIPDEKRIHVEHLGDPNDGIVLIKANFGYSETPDLPHTLAQLDPTATEGPLDLDNATYFLSKIELHRGDAPGMAGWRKRLFVATSHITAAAAEQFRLPAERTILMGENITV